MSGNSWNGKSGDGTGTGTDSETEVEIAVISVKRVSVKMSR